MGSPVYLFGQPGGGQQQPSFIDTLLQRFMTGLQIAQTIKGANQESEERELRLAQLKQQMADEKFKTEYDKRILPLKVADLLSGKQGQMFPGGSASMPGLANVPESLGGPGGFMPGQSIATPAVEAPHPETTVSLRDLLPGTPDVHYRPLNQSQTLAQTLLELRSKGAVNAQAEASKAQAVAGAEYPYKSQLEKDKAIVDLSKEKQKQGFEAEQKALDRANSRGNALIAAGGQTVSVDTVDENGQPITLVLPKANAVGKTFKKPLTGEAANTVNAATRGLAALDDIAAKFQSSYVGPVAGRLYGVAEATGVGVDPLQSEFNASVAAFNNNVINQLSGAAVSPTEWARLQKQLPQVTDPPAVFKSKMNATKDNLLRLQKATLASGQIPLRAGVLNPNAKAPKLGPGGAVANGQLVYDPQGRPHRIVNGQPVPVQ